jgi:hypothetical protein
MWLWLTIRNCIFQIYFRLLDKYLSGRYGLSLLKYVTELFAAQQYDYNVSIRKATIFTDKTGPLTEI